MVDTLGAYALYPRSALALFRRMKWPEFCSEVGTDASDPNLKGFMFDVQLTDGRMVNYTATRGRSGTVRITRSRANSEDAHMFEEDA